MKYKEFAKSVSNSNIDTMSETIKSDLKEIIIILECERPISDAVADEVQIRLYKLSEKL